MHNSFLREGGILPGLARPCDAVQSMTRFADDFCDGRIVRRFHHGHDAVLAHRDRVGQVLSRGYVTTQTMRGFTVDEFRQITADLG